MRRLFQVAKSTLGGIGKGAAADQPLTRAGVMGAARDPSVNTATLQAMVRSLPARDLGEMGNACLAGIGNDPADTAAAVRLWKLAAAGGDINAEYSYAMSLMSGEGHAGGARPIEGVEVLERLDAHPWALYVE